MLRGPGACRRAATRILGAIALAVLLASCLPAPPNHLPAPTVLSTEATPVVEAGTSLTAIVRSFHPVGVTTVGMMVWADDGARLPRVGAPGECTSNQYLQLPAVSEPGVESENVVSCTMPTFASNGSWVLSLHVHAVNHAPTVVTVPFEVVGGLDDPGAPVATLVAPTSSVAAGSTFELKVRLTDVNLAPDTRPHVLSFGRRTSTGSPAGGGFNCSGRVLDWVTPQQLDTTWQCTLAPDQAPGTYRGSFYQIVDVLGRVTDIQVDVEVVAA